MTAATLLVIKIRSFSAAKSEAVLATLSIDRVKPSPEHIVSFVALRIGFEMNALLGVLPTLTQPSWSTNSA